MKLANLLFRVACLLAAVGVGLLGHYVASAAFLALVKLDELECAVRAMPGVTILQVVDGDGKEAA